MTGDHVTELLLAHRNGEPEAFDRLVTLLYADLKRLARRQLARRPGRFTLNTTGLVHESYLKLVDQSRVDWRDRGHFLAIAARAMRQVLIDYARTRSRQKRGGVMRPVTLAERDLAVERDAERLLAVDDALERLGTFEPRLLTVVECRYFAGFTTEETALALNVSARTVERDWLKAQARLRRLLEG